MNKHLNILKQLYSWYWDSDKGGVLYSKWKQSTPFDKSKYIKWYITSYFIDEDNG